MLLFSHYDGPTSQIIQIIVHKNNITCTFCIFTHCCQDIKDCPSNVECLNHWTIYRSLLVLGLLCVWITTRLFTRENVVFGR